MKIVCISDTHTCRGFDVPDGDVLIHAGDLTSRGEWRETAKAVNWLAAFPHRHKLLIAGNHDWFFEREEAAAIHALIPSGVTYLQDSGVEIEGVKFWGSPWQPWFHDWAFNLHRGPAIAAKWALIPEDTQVLITHGPPFGILDRLPESYRQVLDQVGCQDLRERIEALPDLRLHVFGHIHHSHGQWVDGMGRRFVNASICDEEYRPWNPAIVVDLDVPDEGEKGLRLSP